MSSWTPSNIYFLGLMTVGYVMGEIAHFLINTSSRVVAREVHFGDLACFPRDASDASDASKACAEIEAEAACNASAVCEWNYTGFGTEYLLLAGPGFIVMFTISSLAMGLASDFLFRIGRHRIMALGVLILSVAQLLMAFATAYWQLFLLRMGIAVGVSACRPTSAGLIADLFDVSSKARANGIFSWGVYLGYGLAYVFGIGFTELNVFDMGWRASYLVTALPGFLIAALLLLTTRDPRLDDDSLNNAANQGESKGFVPFVKDVFSSFVTLPMILLLVAACFRHNAGYSWAYSTRPFFAEYYPQVDPQYWVLACSCIGGSFGVFFGGYLSDKLVQRFGKHSRLWVLCAFFVLAVPFAFGTLFFAPPWAFVNLLVYYFCAETWFAILFTVIVEIVPGEVRSISISLFLFIMNNIGGNLPVAIGPLYNEWGFQFVLYVFWPGAIVLSALFFFLASIPLKKID